MRAHQLQEIRVKLGQVNKGPAEAFLQDFVDISDEHPFNDKVRILAGNAIHLSRVASRIHIHDISSLDPGKGHASNSIRMLQKLAKEHNVTLELFAKAYRDDRLDTEELINWYQRLGFVPMDDLDEIDIDDGVEMRYYP